MSGELSFFEIGVEDAAKARRFYGSLFGWSFADEGEGASIDAGGAVPGGLHGGDPEASPYVFFKVQDLDAALKQVEELGGSVDKELPSTDDSVERFGRFAFVKDDQGSSFGLHQPPG